MTFSKRKLLVLVTVLTGSLILVTNLSHSRFHKRQQEEMMSEHAQAIPVYGHDKSWPLQAHHIMQSLQAPHHTADEGGGITVITGSLTPITYSILSYLHSTQTDVLVLDQIIHTSFDINKDRQQTTDKLLVKNSIKYEVLEDSDIVNWFKTKRPKGKSIGTLIYSCPVTLHHEIVTKTMGIQHYTQLIKDFVHFLDYVSKEGHTGLTNLRIVLIITIVDNHIYQATMELFIMILYSYQTSYNLDISIAFIKKDFDEEKCSNFNELMSFITKSDIMKVSNVFDCVRIQSNSISSQSNSTNILFSTYFTDNRQFKRPYRENSFQFVKGFVITAKRHNARIVIYYDRIDPGYKDRLLEYYSNIEFIHYNGNFHHRTINDARFYIMYEYLLAHPEIDRIILQDLRDGIFLTDPFKVMELTGDYLFLGMDISFRQKMIPMYVKRCEKKMHLPNASNRYYPMLNAGTLGGTRHIVLAYLKQLVKSFDDIFPKNSNCNMDAVDFIAHYYFHDLLYLGYPFQGFMQVKLASPQGIAIRHKRTKFDL